MTQRRQPHPDPHILFSPEDIQTAIDEIAHIILHAFVHGEGGHVIADPGRLIGLGLVYGMLFHASGPGWCDQLGVMLQGDQAQSAREIAKFIAEHPIAPARVRGQG